MEQLDVIAKIEKLKREIENGDPDEVLRTYDENVLNQIVDFIEYTHDLDEILTDDERDDEVKYDAPIEDLPEDVKKMLQDKGIFENRINVSPEQKSE
jgi:hypothetical protein